MKKKMLNWVYSGLALICVAFGIYFATLAPKERMAFFSSIEESAEVRVAGASDADAPQDASLDVQDGESSREGGRGGPGGGFDPAAIFERRDGDHDGKLTGDEIGDRLRENIDQIDIDKDGSITLEEFRSGMERMFGNRGGDGRPGGFGGGGLGGDPRAGKPDRPQRPEFE